MIVLEMNWLEVSKRESEQKKMASNAGVITFKKKKKRKKGKRIF